jgi:hypothetical protein
MKRTAFTVAVVLLLSFLIPGCASIAKDTSPAFAGGSGTKADPWKIGTAQQFNEIRNHLDGHYVLETDLDLSSYTTFVSIGRFEPMSDAPEDEENPKVELTFTGSFDGKNHKISNVSVRGTTGVGLFGCVSGDGLVKNLVVENVTVSGTMLVGGVIGYGVTTSPVENVKLQGTNNSITGNFLVGGIVGGGFCDIKNCTAEASVVLNGDNAQGVGILAGGMEESSIISCSAKGTVTVTGNGSFSIGGLAACGQDAPEITDCSADVTISITGENCSMIGGLIGHVGNANDNPTIISGCTAKATITAPASAERIGGIAGSGFYQTAFKEYRPLPNAFVVRNSSSSGSITGGTLKGTIAGYTYDNSTVESNCTSTMTIDGNSGSTVGGTSSSVGLDGLI